MRRNGPGGQYAALDQKRITGSLVEGEGVDDRSWKGIVNSELGFYDYSVNDGHPRSAYKNYRQGHFENCVIKYGCISNTYPANTLRSHYNGTWAWSTEGT